jgi:hypothetical protein
VQFLNLSPTHWYHVPLSPRSFPPQVLSFQFSSGDVCLPRSQGRALVAIFLLSQCDFGTICTGAAPLSSQRTPLLGFESFRVLQGLFFTNYCDFSETYTDDLDHALRAGPARRPAPVYVRGPGHCPQIRCPVDGEVESKRISYRLTPEFPPRARLANVSGTVVLHAIVGRNDGVRQELQYVSGSRPLVKGRSNTVRLWRYRVDGERISVALGRPFALRGVTCKRVKAQWMRIVLL